MKNLHIIEETSIQVYNVCTVHEYIQWKTILSPLPRERIVDHLVPIECACGHTKFGLYLGIATEQNYITYSTNVVSKYLLTYLKVHIWTVGIWIIYVF